MCVICVQPRMPRRVSVRCVNRVLPLAVIVLHENHVPSPVIVQRVIRVMQSAKSAPRVNPVLPRASEYVRPASRRKVDAVSVRHVRQPAVRKAAPTAAAALRWRNVQTT